MATKQQRVWLVYDLSDPSDGTYSKLTAAAHSSLEDALVQAALDSDGGRTVVGIYDESLSETREPQGNKLA